jgi:hypothetical protein
MTAAIGNAVSNVIGNLITGTQVDLKSWIVSGAQGATHIPNISVPAPTQVDHATPSYSK